MASKQPITYAMRGGGGHPEIQRQWGAGFKSYLRDFPRTVGMVAVLEDLPVESNRVDPDPEVTDTHGLPAVRLTHRQHPNDLAMIRWYDWENPPQHVLKYLWVVDGSVFPTSGGYNPTLTILANAYRVANHFVSQAKKHSL